MKYIQCVQNANKEVTPIQTIDAIKNAGFDGAFIQWYNRGWEVSQYKQLEYCRQLGLEIEFCHLDYSKINSIWLEGQEGDILVDSYLEDIDQMSLLNIPLVILHSSSKFNPPPISNVGVERFRKIVKYAKSKNIKVAIENNKIEGYLEYLFDNIDLDNMGICFDSGHCHSHFKDKFPWDRFKDKIFAVHLHDNDGSDDQHLNVGDGNIDWKSLMNNLRKANYIGPITLESCYRNEYLSQDLDDFYKISLQRAKELL